jgi:hypothetical protein
MNKDVKSVTAVKPVQVMTAFMLAGCDNDVIRCGDTRRWKPTPQYRGGIV